jgi:micrococcal nuclease
VLFAALVVAWGAVPASAAETGVVREVVDGDTLRLRDGTRVRLLQIDAPEAHGDRECYGQASRLALRAYAPVGARIRLEVDPRLDRTDEFGRLLRYVWRGTQLVNLRMVTAGAAAPYFYRGERGRYAAKLWQGAVAARRARTGLWGRCPSTALRPNRAIQTGPAGPPLPVAPPRPGRDGCDSSYPTVCIAPGPPAGPDLDCADVPFRRFPVRRFDGGGDGIGCERD